jgi:hypothetical protein
MADNAGNTSESNQQLILNHSLGQLVTDEIKVGYVYNRQLINECDRVPNLPGRVRNINCSVFEFLHYIGLLFP